MYEVLREPLSGEALVQNCAGGQTPGRHVVCDFLYAALRSWKLHYGSYVTYRLPCRGQLGGMLIQHESFTNSRSE
jgi:hypothetical protein